MARITALFDEADLKRIEGAVADSEGRTSGELVTVVVKASDGYAWVHALWGILGAAIAVALGMLLPDDWEAPSHGFWLASEAIGGALAGMALPFWDRWVRWTVPRRMLARNVHREALANFTAAGVSHTRDATGILLFISELEHRVEIIADRGIHKLKGPAYWDTQVRGIVEAIRSGRAADGVVKALAEMAHDLAEHFPKKADDPDELHNAVRIGPQY